MAKVAVLGHGVIGSAVAELLAEEKERLTRRAGQPVELAYVLERREYTGDASYKNTFTLHIDDIVNDPEVTVVAEAIGGVEPVYSYLTACLKAGKSVVTANKELVSEKGAQLVALAKENNVSFLFEPSVGGGMPVVRPLYESLSANFISSMMGILNGTSNYILTQMGQQGWSYEDALAKAQELGYAEADPTADVDGIDTGRKISILASLAYGTHVEPSAMEMRGIRDITKEDMDIADQLGYAIKLIGYARPVGDKVEAYVAPKMLPKSQMMAGVHDVYNGVEYVGDYVQDVFFYGRGAGGGPTSSAMVSDMVEVLRGSATGSREEVVVWAPATPGYVIPFDQVVSHWTLRVAGDKKAAAKVVGDADDRSLDGREDSIFFLENRTVGQMEQLQKELEAQGLSVLSLLMTE